MMDRGQALLDAGRCERARAGFDPGGDVHRLQGADRRHAGARPPGQHLCGLRMLAAKNSRKRIKARSPAAAPSAGSRLCAEVTCNMLLFMMQAPAERCGIAARAVHRDVSL